MSYRIEGMGTLNERSNSPFGKVAMMLGNYLALRRGR